MPGLWEIQVLVLCRLRVQPLSRRAAKCGTAFQRTNHNSPGGEAVQKHWAASQAALPECSGADRLRGGFCRGTISRHCCTAVSEHRGSLPRGPRHHRHQNNLHNRQVRAPLQHCLPCLFRNAHTRHAGQVEHTSTCISPCTRP